MKYHWGDGEKKRGGGLPEWGGGESLREKKGRRHIIISPEKGSPLKDSLEKSNKKCRLIIETHREEKKNFCKT